MDVKFQLGEVKFNFRVAGILVHDGKVLLHRIVHEPFWALPGGRVAADEESSKGIQREFQEELGIDVAVEYLLATSENFFIHNEQKVHEIGFYYKVQCAEEGILEKVGEFLGVEDEDLIYQWTPIDDLATMDVRPDFLYQTLKELPESTQHWVTQKGDSLG